MWSFYYVCSILLPGYAAASAILGPSRRGAGEIVSLSALLGAGVMALVLFWLSLGGILPSRTTLAVCLVASALLILILAHCRGLVRPQFRFEPPIIERSDVWLIGALPLIGFLF